MDFELRWAVPPDTSTKPPVLQWRHKYHHGPGNALGRAWRWSEWTDVPTVVVPTGDVRKGMHAGDVLGGGY